MRDGRVIGRILEGYQSCPSVVLSVSLSLCECLSVYLSVGTKYASYSDPGRSVSAKYLQNCENYSYKRPRVGIRGHTCRPHPDTAC